jgi:hypothetical protein
MVRVVTLGAVMCPGCDEPMMAIDEKPVLSNDNLVEVTYVCASCQMTTVRLISSDTLTGRSKDRH